MIVSKSSHQERTWKNIRAMNHGPRFDRSSMRLRLMPRRPGKIPEKPVQTQNEWQYHGEAADEKKPVRTTDDIGYIRDEIHTEGDQHDSHGHGTQWLCMAPDLDSTGTGKRPAS